MSNQTWPWPFVDHLIQHFDLNECEAADLSDWAQRFLNVGLGRGVPSRGRVVGRLWVEAEGLARQGSTMQPTWDMAQRLALTNPHKA